MKMNRRDFVKAAGAATAVGLAILALALGRLPRIAGAGLLAVYGGYFALMG